MVVSTIAPGGSSASASDVEPITVTTTHVAPAGPLGSTTAPPEPEPAAEEKAQLDFDPAALTPEDIQLFVQEAIEKSRNGEAKYVIAEPPVGRPVRVYADGELSCLFFSAPSLLDSFCFCVLGVLRFGVALTPTHVRARLRFVYLACVHIDDRISMTVC